MGVFYSSTLKGTTVEGVWVGNTLNTALPFSMSPAVYLLVPLAKLQIDSIAYWLL